MVIKYLPFHSMHTHTHTLFYSVTKFFLPFFICRIVQKGWLMPVKVLKKIDWVTIPSARREYVKSNMSSYGGPYNTIHHTITQQNQPSPFSLTYCYYIQLRKLHNWRILHCLVWRYWRENWYCNHSSRRVRAPWFRNAYQEMQYEFTWAQSHDELSDALAVLWLRHASAIRYWVSIKHNVQYAPGSCAAHKLTTTAFRRHITPLPINVYVCTSKILDSARALNRKLSLEYPADCKVHVMLIFVFQGKESLSWHLNSLLVNHC